MRPVAFLCLLAVVSALAFVGYATSRRAAEAELAAQGYQLIEPPRDAVVVCLKNRWGFRFRAWRDGRPVAGKVCAGWPWKPIITEDRP